jgi:hypothetical protein
VDRKDEAMLKHRKVSTEKFPMPIENPRSNMRHRPVEKKNKPAKTKRYAPIFEEVEDFEELGRRMKELLLSEPKGRKIYLRVRDDLKTIN